MASQETETTGSERTFVLAVRDWETEAGDRAALAARASRFASSVRLLSGGVEADAKVEAELAELPLAVGTEVTILASGADAAAAVGGLHDFMTTFDFLRSVSGDVAQVELTIKNRLGLHGRAAASFVRVAGPFKAQINVCDPVTGGETNGKSILGILLLTLAGGRSVVVRAVGPDAGQAVLALSRLIQSGFGEDF